MLGVKAMKAIRFNEHGGPEKLRYEDIPEPKAGVGEVKLKAHASCLNHLDLWVLGGVPGPQIPMPHIPGNDAAGEIVEIGDGVGGWNVGDRVVVSPGMGRAESIYSLSGDDSSDPQYKMLGWHLQGCWSEYISVEARRLIKINDRWSMEEWASAPLVFITAWHMLFNRGNLQLGETVLVQAAGSGVGIAAIQIAKMAGATVITTAGSDDKLEKALDLGADYAINYRKEDFARECRRLTGKRGIDLIIDHIGADTFEKDLQSLAKGGRLVTCGSTSGPMTELNMSYLFIRQIGIMGSFMGAFIELKKAMELMARGVLKPVVDSVYPLEQAAVAVRRMQERKQFGKIVLKIAD
jgi:NADPH:quinone reductase-like Zn-dependent oxidoreductase